jgi:hypothetical protein
MAYDSIAARGFALAASAALLLGCAGSPTHPVESDIEVTEVPRSELPVLDPARTYEHDFAAVDPDSVLATLLAAGIPVTRGWLPLDNLCLDPRGPRFTVELSHPDARTLQLDFGQGTGRLVCATTLRRYVVSD